MTRATLSGGAGHVRLTLPAATTAALLTRVPAAFHGGINDVLLTGLVVAVADWCRRRGRGRRQRGAARSGGAWPRGGAWGCRAFAHGGLVHQPVPGAAGCRGARSRRGDGWRCGAGACAQDDQGTAAGAAGPWSWLWAAALPQRADGIAAGRARRAAACLQLSRSVCGCRRAGTGRRLPRRRRSAAGSMARWRWRIAWRSMRSRSMAGKVRG